eukprot:CAMPEP_0197033762 /NCGR_PEP_ID=MMETSP1384-20130603/12078_1 /TAXON_ID=29189 /ORGANISM="Ammonia sp." /LENGTH=521 /DNA_ID=CAMNT_0042463613 /DNA_START=27 /DNA_END=1592 /DNA_ORIENTATION=-
MSSSDDEEKHEGQQNDEEDEDEMVFAGKIPRAATQVTGLTNIEKSKTLMTLSTAKVQTKPESHSKPSAYVPSSDLFKFSNPDRPADDVDLAKSQRIDDDAITHQPTFTAPTAARPSGNVISQRYAQHMMFKSENQGEILFGKFTHKSSCLMLSCSTLLAILFCYVAIIFFPQFNENRCDTGSNSCASTEIPERQILGIVKKEITLVSACNHNFLMFSLAEASNTSLTAYTFSTLSHVDADEIGSMFLGSTDVKSSTYLSACWRLSSTDETMQGYVEIDTDDYTWSWSGEGWYLVLSIIMALFFVFIEWLFYSYNEIMIPRKDYRAYVMWYLIRIGWMSFMFTIIVAHSLMITDEVVYIVGDFDYMWVKADCYIATGFVGFCALICLCCCCFQESDGFSGNPFSSPDDFGFERHFLPQSRMDMRVINDFEQALGTAMCLTMLFVIGFIVCGFVPFIEFLSGGLAGYTYFPYIASIWFLSIMAMTFQMCWFVRARCCGDEEDKRQAQMHDAQIQRAASAPPMR